MNHVSRIAFTAGKNIMQGGSNRKRPRSEFVFSSLCDGPAGVNHGGVYGNHIGILSRACIRDTLLLKRVCPEKMTPYFSP